LNWRDALASLQKLFELNTHSVLVKNQQELIGKQIAELDYLQNNTNDPHYRLNDYTLNYGWYKYFRKAYLETWHLLSNPENE